MSEARSPEEETIQPDRPPVPRPGPDDGADDQGDTYRGPDPEQDPKGDAADEDQGT